MGGVENASVAREISNNRFMRSSSLTRTARLVRRGHTFFRGSLGVQRRVARGQGRVIFRQGGFALLLDVKNPAQINMAPRHRAGIVRRPDSLLKIVARLFHVSRENGDSRQNECGSARCAAALVLLKNLRGPLLPAFL